LARIALDAMGGDFAPSAPVRGALMALAELDAHHSIQLVGRTDTVLPELERVLAGELASHRAHRDRLHLIDAPDVVAMTDKPTVVVRRPDSSMAMGLRLHAEGKSDGFVSAGSTGAQMVGSVRILGLHAGLKRPAIASIFPTAGRPVLVLDAGANVDCDADELLNFARLGAVYAEDMMGRPDPVIGLLSIGEEPEKGNDAVKNAHQLLLKTPLRFIGNVEGRDIAVGECDRGPFDVVVCDGFTGNVLLKFYEGLAPTLVQMIATSTKTDATALSKGLTHLDYASYGGAPLLGVRGVSIIAHGKSTPRAIKNAVLAAVRAAESGMSEHIGRRLDADASAA
jgi:phosphate acyltransferase